MTAAKYLAVFVLIFFTACGSLSSSKSSNAPASGNQTSTANTALPVQSERSTSSSEKGGGGGGGSRTMATSPAAELSLSNMSVPQTDTAPTDRKIVRNAELNLESASPEDTQHKITAIAESKGGFVVESQQSMSDAKVATRDIVTMSVRVPASKFTEALDEIRKTSGRVIAETVKGEDVTEEFVDIEARLKAKKALEQQFVEIMKRATKVEDALNVQNELGNVRSEIERIEGRKRFLENQASLSTIKIRLQTPAVFASSSTGFFTRLGESLSTGIDFALNFILGLVTLLIAILPFALFIVLPLYLIIRYVIKKRGQPEPAPSIAQDETK